MHLRNGRFGGLFEKIFFLIFAFFHEKTCIYTFFSFYAIRQNTSNLLTHSSNYESLLIYHYTRQLFVFIY